MNPPTDLTAPFFSDDETAAAVYDRDAAAFQALAAKVGIEWLLDIPFSHPALAGMDALPTSLANAIFRPRFRRLRLIHLLTGDLKTFELASFGGTKRIHELREVLFDVAAEVFFAQARGAKARAELDAAPAGSPPQDPLLAGVYTSLQGYRANLAADVAPPDDRWLGRRRVRPESPEATFLWEALPPGLSEGSPIRVRLFLERWREGPSQIRLSSHEGRSPPWFALALVDDALGLLREVDARGGALLESTRESLSTAPWERLVAALDAVFSDDTKTAEKKDDETRVIWTVQMHQGDLDLSARVQKRKKTKTGTGAFSKGKRASLTALANGEAGLSLDAEVASVLVNGRERNFLPPDVLLDALEHLSDHPHTYDEEGRRLVVSRVPLELEIREVPQVVAGDGEPSAPDLELGISIGGRSESPRDLYSEVMEGGGAARLLPALDAAAAEEHDTGRASVDDQSNGVDDSALRLLVARPSPRAVALLHALSHLSARFPASQGEALLSRLPRLSDDFALRLPPSLRGDFIAPQEFLVARLQPVRPEGVLVRFGTRPLAEGPLLHPGRGATEVIGSVDGRRVRTERDLEHEATLARDVLASLPLESFTERAASEYSCSTTDDALDLLVALRRSDDVRIEWPDGVALDVTRPATSEDLRVQISRQRDWFGVRGNVDIDGEQVGLALLFDALRERKRYVELEGGKYLALSDALRRRASPLAALTFEGKAGLEVGAGAAEAMLDLEEDGAKFDAESGWQEIMNRLRVATTLDLEVPAGLHATLRGYQREGFEWLSLLAAKGIGGVLADDMGLGKTVQALAVLLARQDQGPALVIAPTSVGFNWVREAERFAPSLRVHSYRGKNRAETLKTLRAGDLVVTSYGLLQRDASVLAETHFATVVFDEAQALKNATTSTARAARGLSSDWAFALTGTPVENHLGELWSIFRVVAPGLLGSWAKFRERYAKPIEMGRDANRQRTLARALRPFLLRRTKGDVAPELPARTEVLVPVELSEAERSLYEQARLSAVHELEMPPAKSEPNLDAGPQRLKVLAAITRLRLGACHPQLLDPECQLTSSKIGALVDLLKQARASGHRALVFSQFVRLLNFAKRALVDEGFEPLMLQGSTPAAARPGLVDAFQRGETDVFLISLKAGGTGLNLTAADLVVHLDPWWNPAAEAQATDRAHRIGRTRPLTVYRLVSTQTVEEEILSLHADKRALASGLWDDDDRATRDVGLTMTDLATLLRDPAVAGEDPPAAEPVL